MVTTRFAPSPTGDPHIGNIRSALFAYLFAKKNSGEFLLRIEDTDRERHDEKSIEVIKEALSWLGVTPENLSDPMIQSTRLEIYKKAALKLVEEDKAYVCNCSRDRLEKVREEQKAKKLPPMYDKHCRELQVESAVLRRNQNLIHNEENNRLKAGEIPEGCVVRMKVPEGEKIILDDIVRGQVEFDSSTIDDQIILKSDGFPTYHLAHVIDDHEMQITHVIRAEEWLPSTPKHILLNKMLGFKAPEYAHLPVILSPTHGKLSKRDGAVGILEYKKMGYLPEALVNFMALLGWNPKTNEEFFTLNDLEKRFDLMQVNKAPAIFEIEKLNFFNRHYLKRRQAKEIIGLLNKNTIDSLPAGKLDKIVELAKERMTILSDFQKTINFLLDEPKLEKNLIVFKKSDLKTTKNALQNVLGELETVSSWNEDEIKAALEKVAGQDNFSAGDVFWPVRYALSGEEKSPPPEKIAEVLDKQKAISRISKALELL